MIRYQAWGRRDGTCGHSHATREAAAACIERFQASVRTERAVSGVDMPWDTDRKILESA